MFHTEEIINPMTYVSIRGRTVYAASNSSVNISCTSVGIPLPAVTWTIGKYNPTPFRETSVFTEIMYYPARKSFISGSVVSTLHITRVSNATYTCTGVNEYPGGSGRTSDRVMVYVLGIYKWEYITLRIGVYNPVHAPEYRHGWQPVC